MVAWRHLVAYPAGECPPGSLAVISATPLDFCSHRLPTSAAQFRLRNIATSRTASQAMQLVQEEIAVASGRFRILVASDDNRRVVDAPEDSTADADNFTRSSGSISPLPPWSGSPSVCDQVCRQDRNGAVASAVPGALSRGPAHFDWLWRERPALALLAWDTCSRSVN